MRLILPVLAAAVFGFLLPADAAQPNCFSWPLRGNLNYDGDTLYITIPGLPHELERILVRVRGIDSPEIHGKCASEKANAIAARVEMRKILKAAKTVSFCDVKWDKYGGRVDATVMIDGENVADHMVGGGFARAYMGGKRAGWCVTPPAKGTP